MFYSIIRDLEYKTDCHRCGVPLSIGVKFVFEGQDIIVGRECAKHYGIRWTEAVGPMADDPVVFQKAIDIFVAKRADYKNGYRWPGGWDVCLPIKEALGTIAWNKAKLIANR